MSVWGLQFSTGDQTVESYDDSGEHYFYETHEWKDKKDQPSHSQDR